MASAAARGLRPLCVFAGLVYSHALIQVACIASAVLGVSLTRGRAVSAILLALMVSVLMASGFRRSDSQSSTSTSTPASMPTWLRRTGWLLATAALGWVGSLWGRLWLLAYERPSYDWDGLYYHIPAIHEWVVAGRVHWLDSYPDVPFVNYPMAIEAHTFLMHQAFGLSRLVDACNLWYWPLAFSSVIVLAKRLGAVGPWPWLAAALVGGAPVLVCQSVTTYIDPGSAACVMAAIAASVLFVFHEGHVRGLRAVLWGASVGLVLGSKGTGLPMSAVIILAVTAALVWREGRQRWTEWLPMIVGGICLAGVVGGYWYARNAWHSGNPLHPIELRFGARVLIEGYDPAWMMRDNQPPWLTQFPSIVRAPVSWLQLDAPIQGAAPVGGLGYIWPLAGIPSILALTFLGLRRHPGVPRDELIFTVGLVLFLMALQPAAWWSRFTAWVPVLGLACLASVLTLASSSGRSVVRVLPVTFSVAITALAAWESERTLSIETARGRVTPRGARGATYLTSQDVLFPGMAEQPGFTEFLEAKRVARSRWGRTGTLLGGSLALPLGQRRIHLLPLEPDESDLARLDASGVNWIIWDVEGSGDVPATLRNRASGEFAYAPAPDVNFHVLRLRAPDDSLR